MKLHRLTAQLVVGAILTLPLWVNAAGLGKLTVRSALGQPLSAEIELLADKAEIDSLKANLASGQAFKDAQIEYAPVLSTLLMSVEKRADGRPILKISSSKPVNDPFLDMLIELNWASGRLLREYTVLLDPPGIAVQQTVSPVAVSIPEVKPVPAPAAPPVQVIPKPTPANKYATEVVPAPAAEKPAPAPEPQKPAAQPEPVAAMEQPAPMETYVRVKRGDTLGKIASRVRPANVSLEQALVGLFHENPDAFQSGNMNRLKSGQKLKVPTAEAMAGLDATAARREVNLQAQDWNAYRAKLAESVAEKTVEEKAPASRTVTGKITPKVEDKAQPKAEEAKDVLKLSRAPAPAVVASAAAKKDLAAEAKVAQEKAAAQAKAQAEAEDKAAREKALKESAERAAALEKQIQDMQKLAEMKEKAQAPAAAGAKTAPAPSAPKVEAKPPLEEAQTSWFGALLENPLYWIGGLAVVVLGGVLWWMVAGGRLRKKKMADSITDSLVTGSGLQPDSVAAGAATGGVVNTGDTSFLTDFSQAGLAEIDTHDVDPIAEADVYMAYGRDAQAEEILKEALTKVPDRHEIRLKLLEIYAARKNVTAFEAVAGELYAALGGQPGPIWDKAVEMGRAIDPHNPLYGGSRAEEPAEEPVTLTPQTVMEPELKEPVAAEPVPQENPDTVGAALDFSAGPPTLDLDLDIAATEEEIKVEAPVVEISEAAKQEQDLDFDLSGFDLKIPEETPGTPAAAPAMDFSGLDLNLENMGEEEEFDEVATKLDLARAYLEMGDKEGAREILQEVINEGNEKQQTDARGIMDGL